MASTSPVGGAEGVSLSRGPCPRLPASSGRAAVPAGGLVSGLPVSSVLSVQSGQMCAGLEGGGGADPEGQRPYRVPADAPCFSPDLHMVTPGQGSYRPFGLIPSAATLAFLRHCAYLTAASMYLGASRPAGTGAGPKPSSKPHHPLGAVAEGRPQPGGWSAGQEPTGRQWWPCGPGLLAWSWVCIPLGQTLRVPPSLAAQSLRALFSSLLSLSCSPGKVQVLAFLPKRYSVFCFKAKPCQEEIEPGKGRWGSVPQHPLPQKRNRHGCRHKPGKQP